MSRRRTILVIALLSLAACGFEPLYGTKERGAETEALLSQITVPPIADRLGQLVRTELNNRLNPRPAPKPRFTIAVTLSESTQGLAVRRDASATRANLIINASKQTRLDPTAIRNILESLKLQTRDATLHVTAPRMPV